MRCKAKTQEGTQCRNFASMGYELCGIHRSKGWTDFVSKEEYKSTKDRIQYGGLLYCSFCGKSQHEVTKLIAGPSVFICDECTDLCIDILWEDGVLNTEGYMAKLKERIGYTNTPQIDLEELGIRPRFNTLKFAPIQDHCFYLCPFSEPFDSVYKDHVKPLLVNMGFTVERANDIFGTQPIIEDIWESINSSEFVIADVTNKNPNVMYEIGMAHTVGKPVVIMTQDIEDVPFDLKHYRCILYTYDPKGIKMLESKLLGTMRFLKGKATIR